MPISLSTIASGATVDAAVLNARRNDIERYVNEQIAAGDRTTNWLDSGHVYRPDFQYAGMGELPAAGGVFYWSTRPDDRKRAALFNSFVGGTALPVPGLARTVHIPQQMSGTSYALLCEINFVAYEWGGTCSGLVPEDSVDRCATFKMRVNGSVIAETRRDLYSASGTLGGSPATTWNAAYYARKTYTMIYDASSLVTDDGLVDVQLVADLEVPASTVWKHVLIQQGTMYVRCRIR